MKKLFFVALAATAMVACTNDEVVSIKGGDAIAFEEAFIDNATRAKDPSLTVNDLNSFKVWGTLVADNTAPVFVFNGTEVTKSGNAWTYGDTQYWVPDSHYEFYAVAPVTTNWGLTTGSTLQETSLSFTNVNGTEDLIVAYEPVQTAGLDNQPESVNLTFNHLLSKVKFTFNTGFTSGQTSIVVENIKMKAPAQGSVNMAGEWTLDNTAGTTTLEFGGTDELATGQIDDCADERLTIPAGADYAYTISFDVVMKINGTTVKTFNESTTVSGVALEAGKAYNFVAEVSPETLGMEPIVFNVEEIEAWDNQVAVDNDGNATHVISTVDDLNELMSNEDLLGANIYLCNDIDLSGLTFTRSATASNWAPVGTADKPFTGTFDGQGYTIKNLALVEQEAKEGKAYIGFFGYAKNATIKNVTFENVYINIPCLDIDHSQGHIGAVAGSLEGTSTIENVTVKGDIKVYATQDANGASRVAVVAGGNAYGNVTMKNVHVIANEGSYLKANNNTGALAGQLQGKNVFENCSSNIDVTVNKFFAGGLIGLAAGDSQFTNCHTTGDIAVVAGREGKAHDQYRVGGIAGGWADGAKNVCTLVNCSYTGELTGVNSDGSVAEAFDYFGYVGRGYTLNGCQGSKVVIDGISFVQKYNTAAEAGQYDIIYTVANAEDFAEAMEAEAKTIVLANDVTLAENYRFVVANELTIDLGGYALKGSNSETATHNFFIDVNGGTLNVSNGTIEYIHTGNNMAWNGAATTIDVTAGGVLNLDGVNVVNKGGTDMNFAVHMNNWGEVTVNAEDCSFEAPYCGFRVFNSGYDNNNVTISNSTFTGKNRAFWVHNYLGDLNSAQHSDDAIKARLKFDIFGKGNTFTTTADAISPIRYGFDKTVYINPENGEEITNIVSKVEDLKDALVNAGAAGAGDTEINLAPGEYTMPADWEPIKVDGYHGADIVTLDGHGAVLKGMTKSLFNGGFAGGSGIVIKNLTIEGADIEADNTQGYGAFVNCADSMNEITLINCHLINSSIITPNNGADESRMGGLVGWTSGYNNQNDGPVKTYVTIKNCSVVGCTIKGAGSIGGICGHAGANAWTYTTIENCEVKDNTLISTDAGSWRVGVAVGTANVGEVVVNNLTESGNTLTQGTHVAPTGVRSYVGRLSLGTTGSFVVDGVAITE